MCILRNICIKIKLYKKVKSNMNLGKRKEAGWVRTM
jgi:hypothetical protein